MVDRHRHQQRGHTYAEWVGVQGDPVLAERELGLILDTKEYVIGDGITTLSGLSKTGGIGVSTRLDAIEEHVGLTPDFGCLVSTVGAVSNIVLLPLSGGTVTIDWGDGTVDADYALAGGAPTHDYGASGQWTIAVTGTATRLGSVLDARWQQTVQAVRSWHGLGLTSLENAFRACVRAVAVPGTLPSSATNMTSMFHDAPAANPDVSAWDVSSVTTMAQMFRNSDSANPDVSAWDVSSVTNMTNMFYFNNAANPDVSGWDVSSVTTMASMFNASTAANPDVSAWNTAALIECSFMFLNADLANPDISQWNIPNVTTMSGMFLNNDGWSGANYDAALLNFAGQTVKPNVPFGAGPAKYTATAARSDLVTNDLWTITDGGPA